MQGKFLLLSSRLGCSPNIEEGLFPTYQEAEEALQYSSQMECVRYVRRYGNFFSCRYAKESRSGYIQATSSIKMGDYQIASDGVVAAWTIQKLEIDAPEQESSFGFKKTKDLIRQNVLECLRYINYINKSDTEASLTDAEVDEIVHRLAVPSETAYQTYLQYLVQDAIKVHEHKSNIRLKLACFRTTLRDLLAADPQPRIISQIMDSLNNINKQIRLMFPDNPQAVPAALQSELDQYAQLNDMLSAYLNSKAYQNLMNGEEGANE